MHSGFGLKPLLLASDLSSRRRPCLRLVLLIVFITMNIIRFSYRGLFRLTADQPRLTPHKFTPMPGVPHFAPQDDKGLWDFGDVVGLWGRCVLRCITLCFKKQKMKDHLSGYGTAFNRPSPQHSACGFPKAFGIRGNHRVPITIEGRLEGHYQQ